MFADLTEADFPLIDLPIDQRRVGSGMPLYSAGDAAEAVFTLRAGLVKLERYLPDGTRRIVRVLRRGAVVGLEGLVEAHYRHDAVVLQDAEICRIPSPVIRRLMARTPRMHDQMLRRWQRSVHEADDWLALMSTGPARSRVARLLLHFAEADKPSGSESGTEPGRVFLPGREDLGAMLAITTETASRIVATLRRDGVISDLRAGTAAIDRTRLEGLAFAGA